MGNDRTARRLGIVTLAYGAALILLVTFLIDTYDDATRHAAMASVFAVKTYATLHVAVGLVLSLFCFWRVKTGHVSLRRNLDLRLGHLWNMYTLFAGLGAMAFPFVLTVIATGAGL